MVKLRLARFGKKHEPRYRIVAIQARTKREGRALEYLGNYNPMTKPSTIEVDADRVKYWLEQGAQPTNTVKGLLIQAGVLKKDHKFPAKKSAKTSVKKEADVDKDKKKAATDKTQEPAAAKSDKKEEAQEKSAEKKENEKTETKEKSESEQS